MLILTGCLRGTGTATLEMWEPVAWLHRMGWSSFAFSCTVSRYPFFFAIKLAKPNVPGPPMHVSTNFGRAWVCIQDSAHGWSPMVSLLT